MFKTHKKEKKISDMKFNKKPIKKKMYYQQDGVVFGYFEVDFHERVYEIDD